MHQDSSHIHAAWNYKNTRTEKTTLCKVLPVCVCVCVCACLCVHACVHACMYACVHVYVHAYTDMHMQCEWVTICVFIIVISYTVWDVLALHYCYVLMT